MKKTLISVSLLAAMSLVGNAQAFTDAPANTAGQGTLTFNGTIDNNTPIWTYEIADSAQFQNHVFNATTGVENGSATEFDLGHSDIALLRGVTKNPISRGRPGLQPVITLGSGAGSVVWDTSKLNGLDPQNLTIDAVRGADVIGKLSISVDGEVATNRLTAGNQFYGGSVINARKLASPLLYAQPWYHSNWAGAIPTIGNQHYVNSTIEMADSRYTQIVSALYLRGNDFKLALNTADMSGEWTAQLPVTIVQK